MAIVDDINIPKPSSPPKETPIPTPFEKQN